MAKKSFWQRGEDYAKKVSDEIIDQIKRGVAPWQKPWKPGEQISAENFSTGQKYNGGNSLYLMSRGIREGRGDNRCRLRRELYHPQRSSETLRLACKIAPICLIPLFHELERPWERWRASRGKGSAPLAVE